MSMSHLFLEGLTFFILSLSSNFCIPIFSIYDEFDVRLVEFSSTWDVDTLVLLLSGFLCLLNLERSVGVSFLSILKLLISLTLILSEGDNLDSLRSSPILESLLLLVILLLVDLILLIPNPLPI